MKIDDQKPSASEQANREDRNRQNVRQKDSAAHQQAAQQAGYKQNRDFQSLFDQALEKTRAANQPNQSEAAKFDSKIKDILSQDDQGKDRDKSDHKKAKDDDKKILSSEEKEAGKSHKEGSVKERVLGKSHTGGQSSGGGSSFSDSKGDSSNQFGKRQQSHPNTVKIDTVAPAQFQNQQVQAVQNVNMLQNVQSLQKIPPQILDQIVQYIRVGLNKNLDKEMQIDLSDKVFRGLSLKVALHQGKLQITFLTANADVRRLFESSKFEMKQALESKGHRVESLQVQAKGNA